VAACGISAVFGGAAGFDDHLDFGDKRSERAHGLEAVGSGRIETLETTLGSLQRNYRVRTVSGEGAAIRFYLTLSLHGKPAVLAIQEVHDRRQSAFGYTVLVNGREVYFRTYQELGAGANHYFIKLPSELTASSSPLRVTVRSDSGAPFSLGQVWLYSDFFNGIAKEEDVYRKMAFSTQWPEKSVSGNTATFDQWKKYADTFSGYQCYGPAGGEIFGGTYASKAVGENCRLIDKSLDLLAATGMGAEFIANASAWGGTQKGPDGCGGDFGDLRYGRITVNPVTGAKNPSYPNIWNNSLSATWAHPHFNQVLRTKFEKVISAMADRLAFMIADGTASLDHLQFARSLGIDVREDYHPETVKAARRDGISLDPRCGASEKTRQWFFNYFTSIYEWKASDFAQALGRTPVRIDRGTVTLPTMQLADNIYAHVGGENRILPSSWGSWQTGMTDWSWASGEFGESQPQDRDLRIRNDYIRSRGKLAMVNRERASLKKDFSYCKNIYEEGFQFQHYFYLLPGDDELLRKADRCDGEPSMPAVHCEPVILDVNLEHALPLGPPGVIVASDNLKAHQTPCDHHTDKMAVTDPAKPGSITYRLSNSGSGFKAGLSLTAMGRIAPGPGNRIEVEVGTSPGSLARVQTLTSRDLPYPEHWFLHQTTETTVMLGEGAKGYKEYYLRLTFHAEKAFDATFLHRLRVGTTWDRRSGQLSGEPFSRREKRVLNLWVQDRAVAERLLSKYRELGGEDGPWQASKQLFDQGRYRSAYRELAGAFSELLPARYSVRGHGKLGRYPLSIQMADDNATAVVNLRKAGGDRVEFAVQANREQKVDVAFLEAKDGRAYELQALGENRFAIGKTKKNAGAKTAANGKVSFEFVAAPANRGKAALPRKITAKYIQGAGPRIRLEHGDLELTDYTGHLDLLFSKEIKTSREADRLTMNHVKEGAGVWPDKDDRVELMLDEVGAVIEIKAYHGFDKGRIKSFMPPSVETGINGWIELENGNRYGLSTGARCDTLFLHSVLGQYEIGTLSAAFHPGEELEITYSPYSYKDSLPRILSLKQPYAVVKDFNYTKMSVDEWKEGVVESNGAVVEPHALDPSYLADFIKPVLYPTEPFTPGSVVYKIEWEKPFGRTAVEYMGRVFEDSSRVEFFVSADKHTWTKCWQFDNGCLSYMPLGDYPDDGPWTFFDVSRQVEGKQSFYLKVQVTRHADDHRFGLMRIRVVSQE
jgi:hypothetical protein